jgi:hypothetical protein
MLSLPLLLDFVNGGKSLYSFVFNTLGSLVLNPSLLMELP